MKRGQRAAQDPRYGAWKLAGILVKAQYVVAEYTRTMQHMRVDGTWRMADELREVPLQLPDDVPRVPEVAKAAVSSLLLLAQSLLPFATNAKGLER